MYHIAYHHSSLPVYIYLYICQGLTLVFTGTKREAPIKFHLFCGFKQRWLLWHSLQSWPKCRPLVSSMLLCFQFGLFLLLHLRLKVRVSATPSVYKIVCDVDIRVNKLSLAHCVKWFPLPPPHTHTHLLGISVKKEVTHDLPWQLSADGTP